jgi:hypothetical protein
MYRKKEMALTSVAHKVVRCFSNIELYYHQYEESMNAFVDRGGLKCNCSTQELQL